RFGWKYVHDPRRLTRLTSRRGSESQSPDWSALPELVRFRLEGVVKQHGGAAVGAMFSPFMSCEEAWLLATFIRSIAPQAVLAMGPVPTIGADENFPTGSGNGNGKPVKFTIRAEKCP